MEAHTLPKGVHTISLSYKPRVSNSCRPLGQIQIAGLLLGLIQTQDLDPTSARQAKVAT